MASVMASEVSSLVRTMTQDRNVTASFAQIPANQHVLQTFAEPIGSGSTAGGNTYVENSSITLTATGGTLASLLSETAATRTLLP